MTSAILTRREFVRISVLASLYNLSGCSSTPNQAILCALPDTLPRELTNSLPTPWKLKILKKRANENPLKMLDYLNTDLIALGDGWLMDLSREDLQPIKAVDMNSRLDIKAKEFLGNLDKGLSSLLFPISVSPWVMLFRNGKAFLPQANKGWDILLDPALEGRIILPSSPRVVISIAERISATYSLRKLRLQAKAFDDQNGLNWLLSGKAQVAVLPLHKCFRNLSSDPRLRIALPKDGAPLNWTLIARTKNTKELFPQNWIEESWKLPLMGKLVARGWIPSVNRTEIVKSIKYIPDSYKHLVLPSESFWENSWSFSSIDSFERNRLQTIWEESAP